jgi:hypothetical protein
MHRRMLGGAGLLVLIATLLAPTAALAAAPSNDSFKTPTAVGTLPFSTAFDLSQATDDPDTPPCEAVSHRRVWYSYTPATEQTVRLSVGGDPSAELALWTVTKPTSKAPKLTGCAVDGSDLIVHLTAGVKYDFSIGQWDNAPPIAGTAAFSIQAPPPNDAFASAIAIQASPFDDTVDPGAAVAATVEAGEPVPTCDDGQRAASFWYRLTLDDTSTVSVSFDSFGDLGIYDGNTLATLSPVTCINGVGGDSFTALAGHTYYLQVYGAVYRNAHLHLEFAVPPANDDFADRASLSLDANGNSADLTAATVEAGEPAGSCNFGSYAATAWWSYTVPSK